MSQFLPFVFLQKVASASNDCMGHAMSTGNKRLKSGIAALSDGIRIAESSQERLFPLFEYFPGCSIGFGCWIIGRGGNEQWKLPCSCQITLTGKGSIISSDHLWR